MPRKTPSASGRQWLQRVEDGETEAGIARVDGHDLRTVRRAVDEARRDRDMGLIRRQTLHDAFGNHQKQLLETLGRAGGLLDPPGSDIGLLHPGAAQPRALEISCWNVKLEGDAARDISSALESELLWILSMEHLGRDEFLQQWRSWKASLGKVVVAHMRLSHRVKVVLEATTGARIGDPENGDDLISPAGAHQFYRAAASEAMGNDGALEILGKDLDLEQPDGRVVLHGDEVPWPVARNGRLLEKLTDAVKELINCAELQTLRNAQRRAEDKSEKARETVGLIMATSYVPGRCRACIRLKL